MFELIFGIVILGYLIQQVIFVYGASKKYATLPESEFPTISILVAARNEENNIIACLESLDRLDYDRSKLEIIIIDDHSTDKTAELVRKFIEGKEYFRTMSPEKNLGHLKGKANALANALKTAKGEIILTTDADCAVSADWAKTMTSYFTGNVAMVGGYTNQTGAAPFLEMQSLDFIYLLAVAAGTMNLGKPLSCIGNNMAYRRSVYEEVGGYEAIPFSVTEDFKLLMAMYNLKKYKFISPLDKGTLVTSMPCENLSSLVRQKKRWGVGGLDSDLSGFTVLSFGFLAHAGILLLPLFFSWTVFAFTLIKFFADYIFLQYFHRKLELKFKLSGFITFQIYFIIYVILLPLSLIFSRKVVWKGREF
ncbi:MAG: glycosyltransferase [Ignavibacteriales bacterium]|nr:glycosyltransferase [Ignavibacteriales bacterium]MCF8435762.1 glycosyltransferase [Ignavibacteriales bacterium]